MFCWVILETYSTTQKLLPYSQSIYEWRMESNLIHDCCILILDTQLTKPEQSVWSFVETYFSSIQQPLFKFWVIFIVFLLNVNKLKWFLKQAGPPRQNHLQLFTFIQSYTVLLRDKILSIICCELKWWININNIIQVQRTVKRRQLRLLWWKRT